MMNDEKTLRIEDMQKLIKDLSEQVKFLTEQNLMLRQQLFGRKSERNIVSVPDNQISLFNEAERESDFSISEPKIEERTRRTRAGAARSREARIPKVTYKRKKRTDKWERDFAGLPTEQIIHDHT